MQSFSLRNSLLILKVLFFTGVCAQCHLEEPPAAPEGMGTLYESKNGWYAPATGVLRILVVLVEVDYALPGVDPMPNGSSTWPAHQLPTWVNNPDHTQDLFDWEVPIGPESRTLHPVLPRGLVGQFHRAR